MVDWGQWSLDGTKIILSKKSSFLKRMHFRKIHGSGKEIALLWLTLIGTNGEPNNDHGSQDCLRFREDGLWDDFECTTRLRPICQESEM